MRSLTIEAKSIESARGLFDALSGFAPELTGGEEEGYRIRVELGSVDRQIVGVLDAVQRHVSERRAEPARVELDGRGYVLHPD